MGAAAVGMVARVLVDEVAPLAGGAQVGIGGRWRLVDEREAQLEWAELPAQPAEVPLAWR